jgi:hypothetical protein
MMNKVKNWFAIHRYIAGGLLLMLSICSIAFGIAQFGPQNNPNGLEDDDVIPVEDPYEIMTNY